MTMSERSLENEPDEKATDQSSKRYERSLFGPLPEWGIWAINGGAMLLLIIAVAIFIVCKRRRKKRRMECRKKRGKFASYAPVAPPPPVQDQSPAQPIRQSITDWEMKEDTGGSTKSVKSTQLDEGTSASAGLSSKVTSKSYRSKTAVLSPLASVLSLSVRPSILSSELASIATGSKTTATTMSLPTTSKTEESKTKKAEESKMKKSETEKKETESKTKATESKTKETEEILNSFTVMEEKV